jgi:serine protease inhibitor
MGVVDAFNLSWANFSEITDGPLVISGVIHQTFIDVQEECTEVAAGRMYLSCCSNSNHGWELLSTDSKPREFKAKCPFMFFIGDRRTNRILFIGKLNARSTRKLRALEPAVEKVNEIGLTQLTRKPEVDILNHVNYR